MMKRVFYDVIDYVTYGVWSELPKILTMPHFYAKRETVRYISLIYRNEKKFVISGLEVAMQPTWHERQSAYVTAVKAFVIKLGIEPNAVEIKFCRSFRTKPKLFLDVECGSVAQ